MKSLHPKHLQHKINCKAQRLKTILVNNANNEDKTHARQTLKKIKALAEKALRSAVASGCLSHPHFGSEVKQTVEELIRNLGITEGYLRDLNKHLESLVGLGNPEHGQLAEWTGYQSGTGNTPDPGDIIDDMEFIEACLLKVQNKTLAVTETHQCTQCHDVFRRAAVLIRHIEVFHDPSRPPALPDVDPQQSSPLFFLSHYQRWLDAINNTASETAPIAKQTLEMTRVLAVETLQ